VFEAVEFPTGIADLNSGLTNVDAKDFTLTAKGIITATTSTQNGYGTVRRVIPFCRP